MSKEQALQDDVSAALSELGDNMYFKRHGRFDHRYSQKSYTDWWALIESGKFNEDSIYEDE